MAKEKISIGQEHTRGYVPSLPPKEKGGQGNQGMNPTPPPTKKSK